MPVIPIRRKILTSTYMVQGILSIKKRRYSSVQSCCLTAVWSFMCLPMQINSFVPKQLRQNR